MPSFRTLLLSGGEPTLRSDVPQLIETFHSTNQIRNVSVPTNGLLPHRIARCAVEVAQIDPQLRVTFNVSIDGPAHIHDPIRGVPDAFASAMQTVETLRDVADKYDNFRVLLNTVICADNYGQLVSFAEHMGSTGLLDGHFFEIIRGDPFRADVKAVPSDALREIYKSLVPIQEHYLVREARRCRRGLLGLGRQVADIGTLINRYRHQWAAFSLNRRWDFPCTAGESITVIDYDGRMRVCELRQAAVDLADYDYDFSEAWSSTIMRSEAATAKTHVCDCTHTCFLGASMRQHFFARFVQAPWLYVLYKTGRLW